MKVRALALSLMTVSSLVSVNEVTHHAEARGVTGQLYQNPIFVRNAPDPAVIRDENGTYYSFVTQSVYGGERVNFPILKSQDLVNWTYVRDALPRLPSWAARGEARATWAPHVIEHQGRYLMYYSARQASTKTLAIGIAISDSLEGPWRDKGAPLMKGPSYTTIDPFVMKTAAGKLIIYWGSAGAPIKAQRLSASGLRLVGDPKVVLRVRRDVRYERLIEAPWIHEHEGAYYLFYSGDRCCREKAHYAVMVARSSSPWGPFRRHPSNPILELNDEFLAPGHNSVITDEAGEDWILYHAMPRPKASDNRLLMIDKIDWSNGWPEINGGQGPSSDARSGPVTS